MDENPYQPPGTNPKSTPATVAQWAVSQWAVRAIVMAVATLVGVSFVLCVTFVYTAKHSSGAVQAENEMTHLPETIHKNRRRP